MTQEIFDFNKSLQQIFEESELFDSGIPEVLEKAGGVYSLHEFLYHQSEESDAKKLNKPVILGLTDTTFITKLLAKVCNGVGWAMAYAEVGVDANDADHTEKFMEAITDPQRGRDIVFVVPTAPFSHQSANLTRREIRWLTEHPDRARNIHFVFGAYDHMTEEWFRAFPGNLRQKIDLMVKELANWSSGMKK